MDIVAEMKKFVEPKSVALIGVSRRSGEDALNILENLLSYGYQGGIYPVNPNASEILGIKAYPSMREVTETIDLAVISLPRDLVPGIVKECTDKGVEAITIVTQGFVDASDEEGEQLQKEINEIAKGKARVLGPNTFGTANAYINFSSSFVKIKMERIPTGLICQTGAFYVANPDLHLLGKGIDLGNSCDIGFAEGLEYFDQDADTKVIALHIEGMPDAKRFLQVANQVASKKPIIALKAGRSEQAAQAAQSHTASLVGKDEIWDVAFKQSGMIRVSDIDEFSDMVKVFSTLPLMEGRKLGVITITGGFGVISIDACQKFGLEIAKLSPVTLEQLTTMSPPWLAVANPVDIWPAVMVSEQSTKGMIKVIGKGMESLYNDPKVDALLCICGMWADTFCIEFCQLVNKLTQIYPHKPLVCHLYGPFATEAKARFGGTSKTPVFPNPNRAIRALGHLADYSEFRMKFCS